MGLKSHAAPEEFADVLNKYVQYVLSENGRTDRSGRFLHTKTGEARSRDYWAKIVKGERAMTTNDIGVLAKAFDMSPYEFVDAAEDLANGRKPVPPNVSAHDEDYELSDDPGDDYGLAAKERPTPET